MNRNIFFVFAILLFSCGNNNDSTANSSHTDVPAEEKQLREAITEHPDSLVLRNNLVDYFSQNGNYQNAIKENDLLIAKNSNNPSLWDAKARLLFLNNDTTGAIQAFKKAINIFPSPGYYISLATLYAQTKNPSALVIADSLLKTKMGDADFKALFIKGLYYTYIGDKQKAIIFFDNCLALNYTFLDAYREKAIAQYDIGKYLDALKTLELSLALSKTNEETYYWMGKCFEKINKKEEAIQNYQMALQIDPEYAEAKDALGKMGVVK